MPRECGGCTACCKLIGVAELNKPKDVWCQHCDKGRGCRIFGQPERPESCSGWTCMWRVATGMPDGLRPDRSKIVFAPDRRVGFIKAHMDPGYPAAHQREPMASFLGQLVAGGMTVMLICGERRTVMSRDAKMIALVEHYDSTGIWLDD